MSARFCCIVAVGLTLLGVGLPAQENINANPARRSFSAGPFAGTGGDRQHGGFRLH
jgi:hypothetical protein